MYSSKSVKKEVLVSVVNHILKCYYQSLSVNDSVNLQLLLFLISTYNDGILPTVKNEINNLWIGEFNKRIDKDLFYKELYKKMQLSNEKILETPVTELIYGISKINRSDY
jgi:hypothetical protein